MRGRGAVRRGDAVLALCGVALVALLVRNGFGAGSWEIFASRFHQNFIQDRRYMMLVNGLCATAQMTFFSALIGLAAGVAISVIRAARDGVGRNSAFLRYAGALGDGYVSLLRGTPVMVQLLVWNFTIFASARDLSTIKIAILAFGLNSAAYVAEIFRGGISSIDAGQMEAARSLGLPYAKAMRLVVLPQALRNVIPMLFNEFVTLFKETSVAGYIGIDDLTRAGQNIQSLTMEQSQPLIAVALIYLVIVAALTKAIGLLERRLHRGRRTA